MPHNTDRYFELGRQRGYCGEPLDSEELSSNSWQAVALREGYCQGEQQRLVEGPGYLRDEVPLWGMPKKYPRLCEIEHGEEGQRVCGCGFGQCVKGLVL